MLRTTNVNISKYGQSSEPDIVYYNCDIINAKIKDEGEGTDPKARFNETRNTAIIDDASKYYFSIVRFSMNGANKDLPIFIPTVEIGQSNINQTIYKVSVEFKVSFDDPTLGKHDKVLRATRPMEFIPQTTRPILPAAPLEKQDIGSTYYYVYTYDHFCRMWNALLGSLWSDLEAEFDSFISTVAGANPVPAYLQQLHTTQPELEYNPSTNRFNILFDNWGFDSLGNVRSKYAVPMAQQSVLGERARLFFDSNMAGLLSNFPNLYLGGDLATSNSEGLEEYCYEILARELPLGENVVEGKDQTGSPTGHYFYRVDQDYSSTSSLWNPIGSIVFVSTLIPIVNEESGEPLEFGQGNTIRNIGTQSAFTPIITDIALSNESAHDYRQYLSYVPSAEYRLASMTNSPTEVRNIDIQVFWKHRLTGELYPLQMYNQSSINVKMMFRKRDFNQGKDY